MIDREEIVAEARKWLGTPYHHQASIKGLGCDCLGLVKGVGIPLGILTLDEAFHTNPEYINYSRLPNPRKFMGAARGYLHEIKIEEARLGDIYAFSWRKGFPQHVGIITKAEPKYMIHSYGPIGKVIEHRVDGHWFSLVEHAFTWKVFAQEYGLIVPNSVSNTICGE